MILTPLIIYYSKTGTTAKIAEIILPTIKAESRRLNEPKDWRDMLRIRRYYRKHDEVKELDAGAALIVEKNGKISIENIRGPFEKRSCSFERIYFSRGSDTDIYNERKKLGELLTPFIAKAVDDDLERLLERVEVVVRRLVLRLAQRGLRPQPELAQVG